MTCIIGWSNGKEVHMSGDSGSFAGYEKYISKIDKVFVLNNEFLIGFAGSWRLGNILRYDFDPPVRVQGIDDLTYLVKYFIESLRETLKDKGYSIIDNNQEGLDESLFLLGYKGNLYIIDSDFHINQTVDGVDSIGAGSKYCLAAFDALTEIKSIKQRMFKALDITVNRCTLVSKPYIYEVLK